MYTQDTSYNTTHVHDFLFPIFFENIDVPHATSDVDRTSCGLYFLRMIQVNLLLIGSVDGYMGPGSGAKREGSKEASATREGEAEVQVE